MIPSESDPQTELLRSIAASLKGIHSSLDQLTGAVEGVAESIEKAHEPEGDLGHHLVGALKDLSSALHKRAQQERAPQPQPRREERQNPPQQQHRRDDRPPQRPDHHSHQERPAPTGPQDTEFVEGEEADHANSAPQGDRGDRPRKPRPKRRRGGGPPAVGGAPNQAPTASPEPPAPSES